MGSVPKAVAVRKINLKNTLNKKNPQMEEKSPLISREPKLMQSPD